MIVSYRDRRTERFASAQRVKEFSGFARQTECVLIGWMLQLVSLTWQDCRAIAWKRSRAIVLDSFQFG